MKKLNLLIILLFTAAISHAQTATDSTEIKFQKVLEDNKMEFTMPVGTVKIPLVKNMQVRYDYAVKFKDKPIEIRYSVFSLGDRIAQYKKFLKDKPPGSSMVDPNASSKTFAYTVALNVGGGTMDPAIGFNAFPPEHVKPEFGADWGGTWIIPIKNNSFGTDYKYGIMISLHRDDVADAYIIYLGNSGQELFNMFKENMALGGLFYSLKFKE
ncbi:MAG: hypothetical protein JWR50_3217 [Mucilaginibacter sp.]|nr:hypothetical protein [Mucilaginibacter sp.]